MQTGDKIGHYVIKEKIGEGGMGAVFLASDELLGRDVAVKFLPEQLAHDEERRQRFLQEARSASALNHPNIIVIHEIGEHYGTLFIASEYITGKTLRQIITENSLNVSDVLNIAEQVCSALIAAHKQGVIHRDIKPENVMVREDGLVKILDFGLAKASALESVKTEAETRRLVETKAGMVMGSVGYMSPEQARGKEVDEGTDIWNVGILLYEMLTRNAPFAGETVTDTLADIIYKNPPSVEKLRPDVSRDLSDLVDKALAKNRVERFATAREMLFEIKKIKREQNSGDSAPVFTSEPFGDSLASLSGENKSRRKNTSDHESATQIFSTPTTEPNELKNPSPTAKKFDVERRSRRVPPIIFGLVAVAFAGLLFALYFLGGRNGLERFQQWKMSKVPTSGLAQMFALSPDGKYLAYVVSGQNGEARFLLKQLQTESEKEILSLPEKAVRLMRFSPDGNYLYFLQTERSLLGAQLWRTSLLGGEPRLIANDVDSGISFTADGKTLCFHRHVLQDIEKDLVISIPAEGGTETILFDNREIGVPTLVHPQISPDGEKVAFLTYNSKDLLNPQNLLMTRSLKDGELRSIGGKWLLISDMAWVEKGNAVAVVGKPEMQADFKVYKVNAASGDTELLTNDLNSYAVVSTTFDGNTLATMQSVVNVKFWEYEPKSGGFKQLTSSNRDIGFASNIAVLPNGNIIFARKNKSGGGGLFILKDNDVENAVPFIKDESVNGFPVVAPDGKKVYIKIIRQGELDLYSYDLNGANPQRITSTPQADETIIGFYENGEKMLISQTDFDDSDFRFSTVDVKTSEITPLWEDKNFYLSYALLSPDGKTLLMKMAVKTGEGIPQSAFYTAELDNEKINGLRKLPFAPEGVNYQWFDNKTLLYIGSANNQSDLWKLNIKDGQRSKLTNFNLEKIYEFAFSPDKKKIYLTRGTETRDIVLLKNDGGK